MPGNFSKLVTVVTGQTITAAERNNEFDNIINNMTPDGLDDASASLAAMQATADPSGGSQATTLRGEIQRLRFPFIKISGGTNWYDTPSWLSAITPATAGATATDLNNRIAQILNQIKNLGALTNWYDAVTAALLKAGGTMAGVIAMGSNKITGLANGTASGDAAAFGQLKVFQIVTATSTTQDSTTSSTFTNTSLTASITPSSASSRILIMMSGTLQDSSTATRLNVTIKRGSTNIMDSVQGGTHFANNANVGLEVPVSLAFIDSPATTSSTAYTIAIKSSDNATTVRFNNQAALASIVLIEVV